jgi:hypothetical protein
MCRKYVGIEKVRLAFEAEGFKLLSNEYINNKQPLTYVCPSGHKHKIRWDVWIRGVRCPYCSGLKKKEINFIRRSFAAEGYKLVTTVYKNNKQKLRYICSQGHAHAMKWVHWQSGRRCPTCAHINYSINYSGDNSPNWKDGSSLVAYCAAWKDKEYKESIKERDGYKCLNPDCWRQSSRLSIHHINYDKGDCGPDNLITLCASCNTRANVNKEWHKGWYKAILKMRYGV